MKEGKMLPTVLTLIQCKIHYFRLYMRLNSLFMNFFKVYSDKLLFGNYLSQ